MKAFEPQKLEEILNADQIKLLEEMDLDAKYFVNCNPQLIHSFMIRTPTAFTDGTRLLFVDCDGQERYKFIYYMGAEREADLILLYKDLAIYEDIDEERLEKFMKTDEKNEAEV